MSKIRWTQWEDDVIRQRYSAGGYAAVSELLTLRNKGSVLRRASALGVLSGMNPGNTSGERTETYWTEAQRAACNVLRNWRYPVERATLKAAA